MHKKKLLKRIEAATLAGVTRAAITKACNTFLKPCVDADRIDVAHPLFVAWLQDRLSNPTRRGRSPAVTAAALEAQQVEPQPTQKRKVGKTRPPVLPTVEPPQGPADRALMAELLGFDVEVDGVGSMLSGQVDAEEIAGLLDWTLRKLLGRFGSVEQFKRWLEARKMIEDIRIKELNRAEKQGELIPRDMVRTHMFGAIENGNLRLLGDLPRTASRRVYALIASGGTVEECEVLLRDLVSSQLRNVKVTAQRLLGVPYVYKNSPDELT